MPYFIVEKSSNIILLEEKKTMKEMGVRKEEKKPRGTNGMR